MDDDRNVVELVAEVVEVASVTLEETDESAHPDWQPLLTRQLFQKVSLAWSLFCLFKRPFRLGERGHRWVGMFAIGTRLRKEGSLTMCRRSRKIFPRASKRIFMSANVTLLLRSTHPLMLQHNAFPCVVKHVSLLCCFPHWPFTPGSTVAEGSTDMMPDCYTQDTL